MPYSDFTNHPRYQRMVQRLARMQPHQKAIMSTLELDSAFADANVRRQLASARMASDRDYRKKRVGQMEEGLDLRRRGLGIEELNAQTASMGQDSRLRFEEASQGIEDQYRPLSELLGIGNMAASAYFGRKREGQELEILKRILRYTDGIGGA